MAGKGYRASGEYYQTPYEKQLEQQRADDAAQREEGRRKIIAARHDSREAAIKAGVPSSLLPSKDQTNSLSDAGWKEVEQRIQRVTAKSPSTSVPAAATSTTVSVPTGVGKGAAIPDNANTFRVDAPKASAPSDLSDRESFSGFNEPRLTGAGVTALVKSEGGPNAIPDRRVAVTPSAEQAMSLATGGKWDDMTRDERTAHLRRSVGQNPAAYDKSGAPRDQYQGSISKPGDAARIAGQYGEHPSFKAVQEAGARAQGAADAVAGEAAKTGAKGSLTPPREATIATTGQLTPIGTRENQPNVTSNPLNVLDGIPTADFVKPNLQTLRAPQTVGAAVPDTSLVSGKPAFDLPLSGAEQAAVATRDFVGSLTDTSSGAQPAGARATPNVDRPAPGAETAPLNSAGQFVRTLFTGNTVGTGNPAKDAAHIAMTQPSDPNKLQSATNPAKAGELDDNYLAKFASDDSYSNW
jgi:hypothetical protein